MIQQPIPTDTLYQSYDNNLYRITGDEQGNAIMDMLSADPSKDNTGSVNVPPDSIGSGVDVSVTQQGVGNVSAIKQLYNDGSNGYWLGIDKDGVAKVSIGPSGGNHILWDGTSLTIVGGVSVGSLNIPDSTTANSMHVDTSGNTWWGANVASGLSSANASITSAGAAIFKNITMGGTTIQYVITNSGIFSYGDGSDGVVTISVDTNLTQDMYYDTLTVNAGKVLDPKGYRIFVKNTSNINGTIARNGNTSGAVLAVGYLNGAPKAGTGGTGGQPGGAAGANGTAADSTTNSLGSNGLAGGAGGGGVGGAGGTGGAPGTATASNVKLIANWHLATLLDIVKTSGTPAGYLRGQTIPLDNSGGAGGGDGGSGGAQTSFGGSGGTGGGGGGIVALYSRVIIIGAAGLIAANGAVGNAGQPGDAGSPQRGGGGGGGGAGGNGGIVALVYNSLTNSGSITASGGAGGAGGAGGIGSISNGGNGSTGTTGSAGTIYQFQLSL